VTEPGRRAEPGRTNRFRALIRAPGTLALGTWIKLPATESAELAARAGLDFVVLDLEHSMISLETAYQLIGTARLSGVSPLVRIPAAAQGIDPGLVQRLLDGGAEGLVLPHVDRVDDARSAVSAARFPPLGRRGAGITSRAGHWGTMDPAEYVRFGQEEVTLVAQIESVAAVRAAPEIAAVPGIDALFVGAADLALDAGLTSGDPALKQMSAQVVAAAHAAGKPTGNSGGGSLEEVRAGTAAGYSFTMLSNDASLLGAALRSAVDGARAITG
jgi:2-keto-3-deoxy-L-rhamnonate aldolase RhmA